MIRICCLCVALAVCAGCRQPSSYGNLAKVESVELVQDAMSILKVNYLPAKTRLVLILEAEDTFGHQLVETMQQDGYAIAEYAPPDKYAPAPEQPAGLGFGYVIDRLNRGDELRLTLMVGDEALSRLYAIQKASDRLEYVPIGFWVRRQ